MKRFTTQLMLKFLSRADSVCQLSGYCLATAARYPVDSRGMYAALLFESYLHQWLLNRLGLDEVHV